MVERTFPIFVLFLAGSALAVPHSALAEFQKRTSENAMVHWARPAVRMPVDPALEKVYGPKIYDALAASADEWALGADVPAIELDYAPTAEDKAAAVDGTGNWVGVLPEWPFGQQLAVTVSRVNAVTGEYAATQVWINPSHTFALDEENLPTAAYDLRGVLTHELGHVLGLGEFEGVPEATMYPDFRRGETQQRTLSAMDRDSVRAIYAEFPPATMSEGCTALPLGSGPRMPVSVFVATLVFVARFHRRNKALLSAGQREGSFSALDGLRPTFRALALACCRARSRA